MKGIVYILVNVGMRLRDGTPLVKIGHTTNLPARLRELYHHAAVPYPFTVYCAVEVEDKAEEVETLMHSAFDKFRVSPGPTRRKPPEFFAMEPERAAAKLRLLTLSAREVGDDHVSESNGETGTPAAEIPQIAIDAREVQASKAIRSPFRFPDWDIPLGSVLRFVRDHSKTAKVVSDTEVEIDGERMRLGPAADKFLPFGVRVAGSGYWEYEDPEHGWELLSERRKRMEREREEVDEGDGE